KRLQTLDKRLQKKNRFVRALRLSVAAAALSSLALDALGGQTPRPRQSSRSQQVASQPAASQSTSSQTPPSSSQPGASSQPRIEAVREPAEATPSVNAPAVDDNSTSNRPASTSEVDRLRSEVEGLKA